MGLIDGMPNTDFIFGFSCNVKLLALAEPTRLRACDLWVAVQTQDVVPNSVRMFDEYLYQARSWPKAWRVLLKAEVMALGENTRFIVTSRPGLDAATLYEEIYCARGQAENYIKHLKDDLASDRTSCTSFLANSVCVAAACRCLCLAPATTHLGTATYSAVAGATIDGHCQVVQDRRAGQAVQE
jgi:hypothetical protein